MVTNKNAASIWWVGTRFRRASLTRREGRHSFVAASRRRRDDLDGDRRVRLGA